MFNWYTSTSLHQWFVNNIWKPSWTKLLSYVYGIPAALITVGQAASSFANDTTISGYLAQIGTPNWIPVGLTTVALLYYVAHGRD